MAASASTTFLTSVGCPANPSSTLLSVASHRCSVTSFSFQKRCTTLISDTRKTLLKEIWNLPKRTTHITTLSLVDSVLSLGISRHFHPEITEILNYVYRQWKECERQIAAGRSGERAPLFDLSTTALAFTMLRLHRYRGISPTYMLGRFKSVSGEQPFGVEVDTAEGISTAIRLLRCSRVRFPGEDILEEAEAVTHSLLEGWLSSLENLDMRPSHLMAEVKHSLEYPWYMSPPRWEARCFIGIFESNAKLLTTNVNRIPLELARLDFNSVQEIHRRELKHLCEWWSQSDVSKLRIFRHRHVESYFMSTGIFEPEFSDVRIAMAKSGTLIYMLDDIYDEYGTLEQLRCLTEAFRRWDLSAVDSLPLPSEMKDVFKFSMETFAELIQQCNRNQGFDTEIYIRKTWVGMAESFLQEAEWEAGKEPLKGFEEYLSNGTESAALLPVLVIAGFLLTNNFTSKDFDTSFILPFYRECSKTSRVFNDIYGFQFESQFEAANKGKRREVEAISTVGTLMKENPRLSLQAAIEEGKTMSMRLTCKLGKMYLDAEHDNNLPADGIRKRAAWELLRHFPFLYKRTTKNKLQSQIHTILFSPIPTPMPEIYTIV